jgi:uncharacterized protein
MFGIHTRFVGLAIVFSLAGFSCVATADTTPQPLPFAQDWSDTGLITTANDWSGVPGFVGYRGDGLTAATGVDPQTVLVDGTNTPVNVSANQANPSTNTTGGIAEFEITDPVVAFQGSGTARAPFLLLTLDTTGFTDVRVRYNLRDIDGAADNAVQPVALHYRVGDTGTFTNVADAFVADASTGPSLATLVTPVDVTLPADADDQPLVQIRWMTADAVGSDEWIGIDDILVDGTAIPAGPGRMVVSEFRPRGTAGAADEFVELYNAGASPVDIAGWKINASNNTGTVGTRATIGAGVVVAPGCFYLVANTGYTGAVTADQTYTTGITDDGGVALLMADNTIVDQVGMSAGSAYKEGTPLPTFGGTNSDRAYERRPGGASGNGQDTDDNSADFQQIAPSSPNNSASDCIGAPPPPTPTLSIADVAQLEGNAGPGTMTFTVTLSHAVPGGVTVEWATAAVSATPGEDYEDDSGQLVFAGTAGEQQTIEVTIHGDTVGEPDETFTVTLSNPDPAVLLSPAVAIGTILNDDCGGTTPIHSIQGSGQESPFAGQVVTAVGVVTGVRNNSFYMQTPVGEDDGDPATSEGIYVFTNVAGLPPGLAIGELVCVTGTIIEFKPAADPYQLPITEFSPVTSVLRLGSGHPLPPPVMLDLADPDGALDQLERYEFMRVTVPQFRVTAPTTPSNASVFFGVVEGTPRPFREPGIDVHDDPLPAEAPANVPRWDFNPELLRVHTTLLNPGGAFPVRAGSLVSNLTGVLDYGFRRYTISPNAAEAAAVVVGDVPTGTAVTPPTPREVTIGGYNVENLAVGSGTGAVWLRKSQKISQVVRDFLHFPDVLGMVEVANLATLQALADRINADAVLFGQPNPLYSAHLMSDGNGNPLNPGTQHLGFLLKRAEILPGVQRVALESIAQYGADLNVLCPDGVSFTTGLLNDRPPLVASVVVNAANGAQYPVSVIANHLKSLIGTDSREDAGAAYACFNDPGNPGGGEGRRNRAKRQQEAEYLAWLVDDLRQLEPGRPVVLVGDFNAFEFNDGYADVIGTLTGVPSPDDETVVPGDGIDVLDPDLIPLVLLVDPGQRYSYTFDGNAQTLDHVIVDEAVIDTTVDFRLEFARVNADYSGADGTNTAVPFRSSDHDPALVFLEPTFFNTAELRVEGQLSATIIQVGQTVTLSLSLFNDGPDTAFDLQSSLYFDPGVASLDGIVAAPGWECVEQAPGVQCNGMNVAAGSGGPVVDVGLVALPSAAGGTLIFQAFADTSSMNPNHPIVEMFEVAVEAPNQPPTISAIADQSIAEDTSTGALAFTISDAESALSCDGSVSAASGNTALVPVANIVLAGTAPDCTVTLTPVADGFGSATITLTVSDGELSADSVFELTVTAVNDAPTISAIADQTIAEDTSTGALAFSIADVDDVLSCAGNVSAASGNVGLVPHPNIVIAGSAPACTVTVTPAADGFGSATITLTVSDGELGANSVFELTVTPVNDAPVAADDAYAVDEDAVLSVAAPGVLANDTDVDGDSLAAVLVGDVSHGVLQLAADGGFVYTPAADYCGPDAFSYRASDGTTLSNPATVSIDVGCIDDPAVAVDDSATVAQDSVANAIDVLANDVDIDGGAFGVIAVTQPANGASSFDAGMAYYTPAAGFCGEDSFGYAITGGSSATVTVTVLCALPDLIFRDGFEGN